MDSFNGGVGRLTASHHSAQHELLGCQLLLRRVGGGGTAGVRGVLYQRVIPKKVAAGNNRPLTALPRVSTALHAPLSFRVVEATMQAACWMGICSSL